MVSEQIIGYVKDKDTEKVYAYIDKDEIGFGILYGNRLIWVGNQNVIEINEGDLEKRGCDRVSQLSFVEKKLDTEQKRKVSRILRSYGNLEAIIKAMSVEMPKMTVNYEASESQRGNQFYSSTEEVVIKNFELETKLATKEKLDIIYGTINDTKRDIWQLRFIEGYTDEQTMIQLRFSKREKYFGEKFALMGMVADSFYLW